MPDDTRCVKLSTHVQNNGGILRDRILLCIPTGPRELVTWAHSETSHLCENASFENLSWPCSMGWNHVPCSRSPQNPSQESSLQTAPNSRRRVARSDLQISSNPRSTLRAPNAPVRKEVVTS